MVNEGCGHALHLKVHEGLQEGRRSGLEGGYPFQLLPSPQTQVHLLQYSLLREVELFEAVILIITGGVEVVSVHLGT